MYFKNPEKYWWEEHKKSGKIRKSRKDIPKSEKIVVSPKKRSSLHFDLHFTSLQLVKESGKILNSGKNTPHKFRTKLGKIVPKKTESQGKVTFSNYARLI